MTRIILPGKTIGIIGGGQLGRMMALAAKEMGYKIAVLDPTKHSPCAQAADVEIVAPYDD
ncbi:NAD(P)-dependent oxidoreductase, partial [Methylobacterium sp. NPDC097163]